MPILSVLFGFVLSDQQKITMMMTTTMMMATANDLLTLHSFVHSFCFLLFFSSFPLGIE
jgi:hypothetical protein